MGRILTIDNKITTADNKILTVPIDPSSLNPRILYSIGRQLRQADASSISSINDFSGNGNNGTQATVANRVLYETNEFFGAYPAARADSDIDVYLITGTNWAKNINKLSLFFQIKTMPTLVSGNSGILFRINQGVSNGTRLSVLLRNNNELSFNYALTDNTTPEQINVMLDINTTYYIAFVMDLTLASNKILVYTNGTILASVNPAQSSFPNTDNVHLSNVMGQFVGASQNVGFRHNFASLIYSEGVAYTQEQIVNLQRRIETIGYL